ncbi:MAG TPA: NUDIX domain-containing protein, partial [Saprospiraceae bacterium]|nr:NUDIX domain-containing protein [Saprospiraceae bacterium]
MIVNSKKRKTKYITSYGIILFYIDRGPKDCDFTPKFLLMQRRDNYEYMDIIRGNWNTEARLKELFMGLSKQEKDRLQKHSFEKLWDDLWIVHGKGAHKDGFEKAKHKFHSISKDKLDKLISSSLDEDFQPPWGFPKGRKNNGEMEKVCALREFEEETKIRASCIKICTKVSPIVEFYKGKDFKNYCTYYFLAEATCLEPIKKMATPNGIRQTTVSEEASDVKWLTYEDAENILVNRRRNILKSICNIIKTKYDNIT